MGGTLTHHPRGSQDLHVAIGNEDIASSIELEIESVCAIGKLKLYDAIGADLAYRCDSTGAEGFAKLADEGGRFRRGCSGEGGEVASETGFDKQLGSLGRLVEFDEEDARRKVVDVVDAEPDQGMRKLGGEDLSC